MTKAKFEGYSFDLRPLSKAQGGVSLNTLVTTLLAERLRAPRYGVERSRRARPGTTLSTDEILALTRGE